MSHALTHAATFGSSERSRLRSRIGWICHALRIAAALWLIWIVTMVTIVWRDKADVLQRYSQLLSVDVGGVSDARYLAAIAVVATDVVFAAAVAVCLWKLASTYLAGRVFTVDAAVWLWRAGIAGLIAIAADIVARITIASIFTGHFTYSFARGLLILPEDLLHFIFAIFVLALAHIFKAAAEMADDHAQIV